MSPASLAMLVLLAAAAASASDIPAIYTRGSSYEVREWKARKEKQGSTGAIPGKQLLLFVVESDLFFFFSPSTSISHPSPPIFFLLLLYIFFSLLPFFLLLFLSSSSSSSLLLDWLCHWVHFPDTLPSLSPKLHLARYPAAPLLQLSAWTAGSGGIYPG